MKVYIYCLFDENGVPLYIGKTKNNLILRERQHQKKLMKQISIIELDNVDNNEWKFWEEYWIEQFKAWGFSLLNQNKGGGGPESHSEISKLKMKTTKRPGTSEKLKNIKRPDVSKRLKNTKLSKITCEKITLAKINHKCYKNPERTEKIIKSNEQNYEIGSSRNQKISFKLIGRKAEWMKYRNKPVLQYDKQNNFIQEWKSASQAALFLKKDSSSISECCNGKRKTAYKYIWKFK